MMGIELLDEIAEDAADGAVATAYARLRAALPAATINLIYRHMATIPGALSAATELADQARRAGLLDEMPVISRRFAIGDECPAPLWRILGVEASSLRRAARILDVYNDSNSRNLVMLELFDRSLASAADRREVPAPNQPPAGNESPPSGPPSAWSNLARESLPPAPPRSSLAPEVRAIADDIRETLGIDPSLAPSLHRHLGEDPRCYGALVAQGYARLTDGEVGAAADRLRRAATDLVATGGILVELASPVRPQIERVCRQFGRAISMHVVLGLMWRRSIGPLVTGD